MAHLRGLTELRELLLNYSFRFGDAGFAHLSALGKLRKLSMLRTTITDKSLQVLAGFTGLEELDLNYTSIGDAGLASIAGLSNLTALGLDSTNITDKSAEVLIGLKKLAKLNLYHTLISPPVHKQLKTALPGCSILWDEQSANPNRRRS